MSSLLLATIAGVLTAIFWGVGDWLTPRNKSKLTQYQIGFTAFLIGVIMYAPLMIGLKPIWPHGHQLLQLGVAAIMISVGYLLFVKALNHGAVGVVVPLASIYPLITLLLSLIFLNQSYKALQIPAMIVITAGAFLLSYAKNDGNVPFKELHRATMFTLGAVVIWGVGFYLINPLVPKVQWQVLLFTEEVIGFLLAAAILLITSRSNIAKTVKAAVSDRTIFFAGLLLGLGALTLYIGASKAGNITIPAVLGTTSALITSALGAAYDHEKLGILKRSGAVAVIAGVIMLNLN